MAFPTVISKETGQSGKIDMIDTTQKAKGITGFHVIWDEASDSLKSGWYQADQLANPIKLIDTSDICPVTEAYKKNGGTR